MQSKKWLLMSSASILLISLCVIFPIEKSKSAFLSTYIYTYLTLGVAMLLGMYSLMGNHFFKGLLFLVCSTGFSFCGWYLVFYNDFWGIVPAIYGGIPSGLVTGLLFLIVDGKFLRDKYKNSRLIKRVIIYLLILLLVSVLFEKGGDWAFELSEYFKNKK